MTSLAALFNFDTNTQNRKSCTWREFSFRAEMRATKIVARELREHVQTIRSTEDSTE